MKKVSIDEVVEGEIVAADVFEGAVGGEFPLLGRGVVLTPDYIKSLKKHGVNELLVVTPPGYRGRPGEILAPTTITEDIFFDGGVELNCKVPRSSKIEAAESIRIEGEVEAGCVITSATGSIVIRGAIKGTSDQKIRISAAKNVVIETSEDKPIAYVDIKTVGGITITGGVQESTISARGEIQVSGQVLKSQVYTQTRMKLGECGDELMQQPCVLVVKPYVCRDLLQELLKNDTAVAALRKEKEKLVNLVDLIKKMGKNIEQLPPDKKIALASGIKRFQEVEAEIRGLESAKVELKKDMERHLGVDRILVRGKLFPGAKIMIENYGTMVKERMRMASFSVQNHAVVSTSG